MPRPTKTSTSVRLSLFQFGQPFKQWLLVFYRRPRRCRCCRSSKLRTQFGAIVFMPCLLSSFITLCVLQRLHECADGCFNATSGLREDHRTPSHPSLVWTLPLPGLFSPGEKEGEKPLGLQDQRQRSVRIPSFFHASVVLHCFAFLQGHFGGERAVVEDSRHGCRLDGVEVASYCHHFQNGLNCLILSFV